MPPIYVKPENALRRTEELLALGTASSEVQAFENLTEVFQSKRFKHTPTNVLEPIVMKYLDLCIHTTANRKQHARGALVHYRNAVQGTSVQSIEAVLNHFIAKAEANLAEAMEKAQKEVAALPGGQPAVEAEDDDEDELPLQPSSILLDAFVDNAGDADRIERRVIAPAQKMCWDAYDICLDVSKSNDRLELIYNDIAHRAFNFCKVHERKSDFRRLCEQRLRKDLSNAGKYAHQQHAVNLQDPETLSRHLDTRFLQLDTAVQLELWQEAFRSVEDVHGLVAGKKQAKPSMMANYYEKVTQIFHAEGGKQTAVFHAAAWSRYFQYAERAGTVADKAPGCVLLSALAVPLGEIETKQRLITLLNLPKMPSRDALVKDAAAKHLRRVSPEIRQIYHILEVDFQPFKAAKTLAPLLASIPEELQTYLPALREVVLARMLLELAKVYDTITLSHVLSLVKPFDGTAWATDMPSLEKYLVNAARSGEIKASIDHVQKAITFETKAVDTHRVSNLAACLYNALQYLQPAPATIRADAFAKALAEAEEERKSVQHKRQIVTKRRELLEEANIRREREESTAKAERTRIAAEEQAKRERDAAKQAEVDRLQKQIDTTRREEARKLAEQLAAKGALKVDITKLETLDSSEVLAMQVQQLDKEKRDLNDRSRIVAKRVDHLERAYRKEERPLLADDYERQKEEDKRAHERAQEEARKAAIEQQALAVETKKRLARMMPDYLEARQAVESLHEVQFEKARKAAQRKIEEEKEKFRKKVLERRQQEREAREAERQRQEEEDRIAREQEEEEERQAAEKEEQERAARAEADAKKAEAEEKAAEQRRAREAQRAADAELIRKQREREEEAERRRAERASGAGGMRRPLGGAGAGAPATGMPSPASAPVASAGGPPTAVAGLAAAGGGGWREKLAAKKAAEAAGGSVPAPAAAPAAAPSMGRPSPSGSPAPGAAGAGAGASAEGAAPERGGAYRRGMGLSRGGASSGAPSTRGGAAGGAGASRW